MSASNAANSAWASADFKRAGVQTVKPRSSAKSCTGDWRKALPRPAGRGGCEYTATMWCPAATRAFRATAAKSGVPMKITLSGVIGSHGDGLVGLLRLQELAQDDVALQRREMIDEQDALEMIHLVLNTGREQTVGFELADLVLMVEVAHLDRGRPGHVGIVLGQAEAALVVDRVLVGDPDQLRV